MQRTIAAFLSVVLITSGATSVRAKRLEDVFRPNAPVCVKFDQGGNPIKALVDGKSSHRQINAEMLAVLQKGTWWGANYSHTNGKWMALSVAPNGYPVPEILPTCPRR